MAADSDGNEIIARFQAADGLLEELRGQAAAVRSTVGTLAGHDRSLAEIASNSKLLLRDLEGLGSVAAESRAALVKSLTEATDTIEVVKAQAQALDAQRIAGAVDDRLDEMKESVLKQFNEMTAAFEAELLRLDRLATQTEDRLRFFEADRFLEDVDDRVEKLTAQVSRLSTAAKSVDELVETVRRGGLRDLGSRIDKLERNLRPPVLITAYVILVAVALAGLMR
jgi:archaellum component FlaC